MKSTRKKTPAEIAAKALEKDRSADISMRLAFQKLGIAVRFSFLRVIRREKECDEAAAILFFEAAVKKGEIVQVWPEKGGVKFYKARI